MTILESSELLLQWFQRNDSFNFEDNFKELIPNYLSETPEADKASILCALKSLEENKAVKCSIVNKQEYYVLIRPFETMEQNVSIGYNTILVLTEITRKTSENTNNKDMLIDPLNITEKDILVVLNILMTAAKLNINNE